MTKTKRQLVAKTTEHKEDKDEEDEKGTDPMNPNSSSFRPKGGGMPQRQHYMNPREGTAEHPRIPAYVQDSADTHEELGQARLAYGNARTLEEVVHIPVQERGSEYKVPVHVAALAHAALDRTVEI